MSAARFGLVCFHKSIKGDFLLKIQLSDLTKSIFGHPKGSLTICSIPLLCTQFLASGPFRRGVSTYVFTTWSLDLLMESTGEGEEE